MGLSSKKTTQKTTPIYDKQITGAANTLASTYNANAPKVQGYADTLGAVGTDLLAKYREGNPMMDAASGWITSTLSGDGSNPHLEDMIRLTNDSVRNQTQAAMGTRGLTGGSSYADIISRNLANNETGLRYNDFNQGEARKATAAGMAPGIAAGDFLTLAPALSAIGGAASLPMDTAARYAAGTGGLLGGYTNTQSKQSGGLLGDILGAGLAGWASGGFALSDEDAKTDKKRVGETDEGLPIYTYRYKEGGPVQMGVMAQDVKKKKPKALGPILDGYMTVDYGKVS